MCDIPELFFEHNDAGLAAEYAEELAAAPLPHGWTAGECKLVP